MSSPCRSGDDAGDHDHQLDRGGETEVIWNLDDDFNHRPQRSFRGERHHLYAGHLLLHEDLGSAVSCARSAIPHHLSAPQLSEPVVLKTKPAGARVSQHFSSFIISGRATRMHRGSATR